MPTPSPSTVALRRRNQRLALAVLLGLTFVMVAWMAAPLLVGLALGTVMGFTAEPLHTRLTARLNGRRGLASTLTTLVGGLLIAGGGVGIAWIVVNELEAAVPAIQGRLKGDDGALFGAWGKRALTTLHVSPEGLAARLHDELGRLDRFAGQAAGVVVQASAGVVLTVVISLWTMYYVLQDWPRISGHLERLLPLDPRHTRALVAEFRDVGRNAFVGTIASAAIQGVVAGAGFAAAGVPQPIVWGTVLAVTSFIPVIGVPLVWIPAAFTLLASGHVMRALALVAWCLVVVMAANDYYVKPRLVGRGGSSHPLLMLVGLIGGISVFGIAGVIVGPIIMALFVATARILEREREEAPIVSFLERGGGAEPGAGGEPDPPDSPSGVHAREKLGATLGTLGRSRAAARAHRRHLRSKTRSSCL
jgi:predicted PurR-regulated permease PerM